MKGHVRKRGRSWAYVVDLGMREAQRCTGGCGSRFWVGSKRLGVCPRCGSPLEDVKERRQQWTSGLRTKTEAERGLAKALASVGDGSHVVASPETLGSYLIEWLDGMAASVRPSTLAAYRINVNHNIVPALGAIKLQSLTSPRIKAFYAGLTARGLAPKTVRNVHVALRKALGDAMAEGRIVRNPASLHGLVPRVPSRELNVWTAPQLRTFLEYVRTDRLYAGWMIACTTGMRRGEILGLRWKDVDLQGGRLSVTQTVVLVDGKPIISQPKTDRSSRRLALDPVTVAALKSYRRSQAEEKLAWGPAYQDTGLVFTREDGGGVHPEALADRFAVLRKAAGLPPIRLHDLRHSYATAALSAGIPAKIVSERLGHASVGITLDTYSHVLPSMDDDAATKVANLILGT